MVFSILLRFYLSVAGNVGLVLRVPTKIRALDELFPPKVVELICDMPRGLVFVTGVTGSGKFGRDGGSRELFARGTYCHD